MAADFDPPVFLPGSSLGILGGGQLGRMLCLEARRMGYRTVVWSGIEGGPSAPVEGVADVVINRGFDAADALAEFAGQVDVVTFEFENIPRETIEELEKKVLLRPAGGNVAICQHRRAEKMFLRNNDIPCAPFEVIESLDELKKAYAEIGPDAVLKTAAFGYDGKGQVRLRPGDDPADAWIEIGGEPSVLEGFVDFECEMSVIIARTADGSIELFPPAENQHRHHILDLSLVPARVREESMEEAFDIAINIVSSLDYVGLLAVEFFVLGSGEVLVNEMAPRPHNSGHYTMDGCLTSQFEQQLRAVCGLPLGSTELFNFTVMLNLLGDMWRGEPRTLDTAAIFDTPGTSLHLYGKGDPGERRKMGHVNLVGEEDTYEIALELKERLLGG